MDKLTNLEHLKAASQAAKGLIGEVAVAAAEALEELAAQQQGGAPGGGIPSGLVAMWSGAADNIPDGWALCNGENGTPDLRDRFVVGAGSSYSVGATGGEKTHTLTVSEMPSHSHSASLYSGSGKGVFASGSTSFSGMGYAGTSIVGSGAAHNNMPPYYALCYIMKL